MCHLSNCCSTPQSGDPLSPSLSPLSLLLFDLAYFPISIFIFIRKFCLCFVAASVAAKKGRGGVAGSDMCVRSLCRFVATSSCTICVSMRCLIPSQRRSQETQSECTYVCVCSSVCVCVCLSVCLCLCVIVWHVQNAGRCHNVQLFGHFVFVFEFSFLLPHSLSLSLYLSPWRYLRSHLCILLYFVHCICICIGACFVSDCLARLRQLSSGLSFFTVSPVSVYFRIRDPQLSELRPVSTSNDNISSSSSSSSR